MSSPPKGPYHAPEYDVCEFEGRACGVCVNCTMPQADPRPVAEPEKYPLRNLRQWLLDFITKDGSTRMIPTMALFESAVAEEARREPHAMLAIAKKAAEYSRGQRTNEWLRKHDQSLWIALRRLDAGIEWVDQEDAGHLDHRITLTGRSIWDG